MIEQLVVGPLGVNTYFVIDPDTKKGVVIDPGAEASRILDKIKSNQWDIKFILLTHGHWDHIGGAKELADALGCPIVAHEKGQDYLEDADYNLSASFGSGGIEFKADLYITENREDYQEILEALPAVLDFKVLHVPGHTRDSIVFYFANYEAAIVGDVIFRESIGRTDFKGGSGSTLLESIRSQVFTLPDQTTIYPGHGPSTSVSHEKNNNPYFGRGF